MTLPPRTPTPCRVKTTPASMRRNPAPTSATRLMMPPSGARCLAVTCSDLPDHGQAISRGLPPAGQGGWTCGTAHGRTSADTYRTVRWFSLWSVIRAGQGVTAVLTFLRDAGLRGCASTTFLEQLSFAACREIRRTPAPGNLAIVALLSQLTVASDTPIGGGFRARNAPSKDAARVS